MDLTPPTENQMNRQPEPSTPKPALLARLRGHRLATTFVLLATLSAGILIGSVVTHGVSGKEQQAVDSSDARPLSIPDPVTLSNGFSKIAKEVGPAVVNINTEETAKPLSSKKGLRRGHPAIPQQNPDGDGSDDNSQQGDMQDFFNRFFGGQNGQGGDDDGSDGGSRRALGSGFIVDSRGYIITNNHVVDKADKIYVKLSTDPDGGPGDNGRPAHVVGVDKDTDIAVIKIDAKEPLPTIKLGNSDGAQVGDWVLAVGSPFALAKTVTAGIVSAKNRSIPDGQQSQFQRFIQTDAAINPGNSGGPLVDMTGSVIGMNTAIYTQSAGSEGVGFAMPSNTIINVYNMLIGPDHKVTRGSIGISFQPSISSAVTRMYGFTGGGVMVNNVDPNASAAKAGIKPDDIIVSVDGRPIKDGDDLVDDISRRKVGSTIQLGFLRDGKKQVVTVAITDRSKIFVTQAAADDDNSAPAESDAGQGKLGITVSAVPPALASKLGTKGVVVTAVRPDSFADDIGLFKGYVIVAINKIPVTDEASYKAIVSKLKSGEDVVFVVRNPLQKQSGNSYVGGTLP
jgi:serine protease Do